MNSLILYKQQLIISIPTTKSYLNKKSENVNLTVTTSVLPGRVISNQNAIRTYTKERNDIFEQ